MGFGSFFKHLVKVKSPLKVLKKTVTAVATGGLSLIAPKKIQAKLESVFAPPLKKAIPLAVSAFTGSPSALITSYTPSIPTITPRPVQGATPMGFNLGQFLGGVGGAVQTLTQNTAYGGIGQIAGAFGSAFSPPVTAMAVRPPMPVAVRPPLPIAGRAPVISGVVRALNVQVMNIIHRISGQLGRNLSFQRVIGMIRSMGKQGLAPAAIATALGITLEHLSQLITANSMKKRRAMNACNIRALRRSIRRVESFHKLAQKADILRQHGHSRHKRPCPPSFRRKKCA